MKIKIDGQNIYIIGDNENKYLKIHYTNIRGGDEYSLSTIRGNLEIGNLPIITMYEGHIILLNEGEKILIND